MTTMVLGFEESAAVDAREAGGKGASLARLTQAGFDVPPGFVVTARAYREFAATIPGLQGRIARLDARDPDGLRRACEELRTLVLEQPLPDRLASALRPRLRALLSDDHTVSVRSSATLEDMAGAAFAGQHETLLDVRGEAAVLEAVRRCYASLWEDRAVRYRVEQGFAPDAADMAVVVQRMVASEIAGVAFTINPITGDAGQCVVNSAWGLGETVVSGSGDVDQFVLDKEGGRVVAAVTGEKTHALVSGPTGPVLREVAEGQRHAPSLDAARLRELCELSVAVERHHGFPQDIEWAFARGRLHLLQARPVTRFPARWTRDESAERFPNPVTPLTWDFTSGGFHESLAHSLELMGLPAFQGRWFERFDGYVYGNQTAVRLFTSGQQVAFSTLDELAALVPTLRERYRWVQELPVEWARDLDRYLFGLGRLSAVDLETLDDARLWLHVLDLDALGRGYFLPNIAISITHGVLHRTLFRLVQLVAGVDAAPAMHDALTGYCETKTSVVNRDLYGLYRLAAADRALVAKLQQVDRERLWRTGALGEHPVFLAAFERFLESHGHREVDFDAYHPTWIGQPWVVLENIRLMLARPEVPDPSGRENELRARQAQAERQLLAALPEPLRNFAAELVRLTRAYTALDDLEHYQTTRLNVPFRAALIEVGRRLEGRGALDRADDVFFLGRETLERVFDPRTGAVDPAEVLEESRAAAELYRRQLETTPPHVYGEEAEPAPAGALHGLPGSPGSAEGPVCLVHGVEDFAFFRPGCVLVARTTNPAWTPLFYSAVAVITESGGPLSHGAVTAREVGIPAVMGVRGALNTFRDGDVVRVNGTTGAVSRA